MAAAQVAVPSSDPLRDAAVWLVEEVAGGEIVTSRPIDAGTPVDPFGGVIDDDVRPVDGFAPRSTGSGLLNFSAEATDTIGGGIDVVRANGPRSGQSVSEGAAMLPPSFASSGAVTVGDLVTAMGLDPQDPEVQQLPDGRDIVVLTDPETGTDTPLGAVLVRTVRLASGGLLDAECAGNQIDVFWLDRIPDRSPLIGSGVGQDVLFTGGTTVRGARCVPGQGWSRVALAVDGSAFRPEASGLVVGVLDDVFFTITPWPEVEASDAARLGVSLAAAGEPFRSGTVRLFSDPVFPDLGGGGRPSLLLLDPFTGSGLDGPYPFAVDFGNGGAPCGSAFGSEGSTDIWTDDEGGVVTHDLLSGRLMTGVAVDRDEFGLEVTGGGDGFAESLTVTADAAEYRYEGPDGACARVGATALDFDPEEVPSLLDGDPDAEGRSGGSGGGLSSLLVGVGIAGGAIFVFLVVRRGRRGGRRRSRRERPVEAAVTPPDHIGSDDRAGFEPEGPAGTDEGSEAPEGDDARRPSPGSESGERVGDEEVLREFADDEALSGDDFVAGSGWKDLEDGDASAAWAVNETTEDQIHAEIEQRVVASMAALSSAVETCSVAIEDYSTRSRLLIEERAALRRSWNESSGIDTEDLDTWAGFAGAVARLTRVRTILGSGSARLVITPRRIDYEGGDEEGEVASGDESGSDDGDEVAPEHPAARDDDDPSLDGWAAWATRFTGTRPPHWSEAAALRNDLHDTARRGGYDPDLLHPAEQRALRRILTALQRAYRGESVVLESMDVAWLREIAEQPEVWESLDRAVEIDDDARIHRMVDDLEREWLGQLAASGDVTPDDADGRLGDGEASERRPTGHDATVSPVPPPGLGPRWRRRPRSTSGTLRLPRPSVASGGMGPGGVGGFTAVSEPIADAAAPLDSAVLGAEQAGPISKQLRSMLRDRGDR